MRVCSIHGCANLYPTTEGSRCRQHVKEADRARGTATERGYTSKGHKTFRSAVLTNDPICVVCQVREANIADHYPHSRKELIELGMNPNNPTHGRGLCKKCHDQETAQHQRGGWNDRD
jgi:5-methylcytosine-specific restriction protein A